MRVTKLPNAKNLPEVATRLYGLKSDDPRIAGAVRALAAANPRLARDVSAAPPDTPIVVPPVDGLSAAPQLSSAVPQDDHLLKLVGFVAEASKQMIAAIQPGAAPAKQNDRAVLLQRFNAAQAKLKVTPPAARIDPKSLSKHADELAAHVAAFLKVHGRNAP
jgi:hypothetical protein